MGSKETRRNLLDFNAIMRDVREKSWITLETLDARTGSKAGHWEKAEQGLVNLTYADLTAWSEVMGVSLTLMVIADPSYAPPPTRQPHKQEHLDATV